MQIVSKVCRNNNWRNVCHIEYIYCIVSIFLFCCLFIKIKINLFFIIESLIITLEYFEFCFHFLYIYIRTYIYIYIYIYIIDNCRNMVGERERVRERESKREREREKEREREREREREEWMIHPYKPDLSHCRSLVWYVNIYKDKCKCKKFSRKSPRCHNNRAGIRPRKVSNYEHEVRFICCAKSSNGKGQSIIYRSIKSCVKMEVNVTPTRENISGLLILKYLLFSGWTNNNLYI